MKNRRDFFIPSFSTLVLFGLIWFISCSHQMRMKEVTQLREDKDWEGTSTKVADATVETQPETPTATSTEPSLVQAEAVEAELQPAEKPREEFEPKNKSSWSMEIPEVAVAPIQKGRANLNRFYFLRKGDSPKKVSEMIYGNTRFSKKLWSWNPIQWFPGNLIYYQSALKPNGSKMSSFYQEKGFAPVEYVVKKGESLSLISKRILGHYRSWREIASMNGLRKVDQISVGVKLALYADLPFEEKQVEQVAQATIEKPAPQVVASAPVQTQPVQTPPQAQALAPTSNPMPAPEPAPAMKAPQIAQSPTQSQRAMSSTSTQKESSSLSVKEKILNFFANTLASVSEWAEDISYQASKKFKK
jgi:nucleoid-associated protein YgaU